MSDTEDLKKIGIDSMRHGKSFRSSIDLHLKMKQMKKGETIALLGSEGARIFRLEEITSHKNPTGKPLQINEKIFDN